MTLGSQPALPSPTQQSSSAPPAPAPARLLRPAGHTSALGDRGHSLGPPLASPAATHSLLASSPSTGHRVLLSHATPAPAPTPALGSLEGKFQISSPKCLGQASDTASLRRLRVPGDPLSLKGQDGLWSHGITEQKKQGCLPPGSTLRAAPVEPAAGATCPRRGQPGADVRVVLELLPPIIILTVACAH